MGIEHIKAIKEAAKFPKPKKIYTIAKKSAKKIAMEQMMLDADKVITVHRPKGSAELQRWFEERHKEMTGFCKNCGGKTQKGKENYKNSIAHILPKSHFKSVATNEYNWIELCFYGKSCHSNMDNNMLDLTEMSCWNEIVTKFCIMYPSIAKEEKRRIPQILLQYVETEL